MKPGVAGPSLRRSSRSLRRAALAAIAALAVGCQRAAPPATRELAHVRVFNASVSPKASLVRRGEVHAGVRLKLGFKVPGLLSDVRVKEGERVRRGQVVAQLCDGEAKAIAQGADVRRAAAARELALADQLSGMGATSARSEASAREELAFAQANAAAAAQAVSLMRIVSPVDGTVYRRLAEPGESVASGSPVLVVDDDRRVVRFGLGAEDLQDVRMGQLADVTALDPAGSASGRLQARIESISQAPDLQTGLYAVEAAFVRAAVAPRVGTLVEARLARSSGSGAIQVPLEALVSRAGRTWVAVLHRATPTLHFVQVEVGRVHGLVATLDRGLVGGEVVVAEGAEYFLEGDQVVLSPLVTEELSSRTAAP